MIIDLRSFEEARVRPVQSDIVLGVPPPPLSPFEIWQMAKALFNVVGDLPKNAQIHLFCAKGRRSALGWAMLHQAGYTNVIDLGGVS